MEEIKRVTLTSGEVEEVVFEKTSQTFLVKNFSETDVYVGLHSTDTHDNMIRIPAGFYEVCHFNGDYERVEKAGVDSIFLDGAGEIEVHELFWH